MRTVDYWEMGKERIMNDRKPVWTPPVTEIIYLGADDVIRTSDTQRQEEGVGDKTTWNDLFGDGQ